MEGLNRIVGEMADGARRDRERLKRRCAGAGCTGRPVGSDLMPGARVLDLVSGLEGVTRALQASVNAEEPSYEIELSNHMRTTRRAAELLELPEAK